MSEPQRIQLSRTPPRFVQPACEEYVSWCCPACGQFAFWEALDGDVDVIIELLERDVEQHEHEAHGIEAA